MVNHHVMGQVGQAAILGIIEGLTEYIPVSSTGHLILVGDALGFSGEKAQTFEIFIQLGAILSVVLLYWNRFMALLPRGRASSAGVETRKGFSGWHGILKLIVACIPAFVFGALFHKAIKARLFTPVPVAFALIVGGVVMSKPENGSSLRSGDSVPRWLVVRHCSR